MTQRKYVIYLMVTLLKFKEKIHYYDVFVELVKKYVNNELKPVILETLRFERLLYFSIICSAISREAYKYDVFAIRREGFYSQEEMDEEVIVEIIPKTDGALQINRKKL